MGELFCEPFVFLQALILTFDEAKVVLDAHGALFDVVVFPKVLHQGVLKQFDPIATVVVSECQHQLFALSFVILSGDIFVERARKHYGQKQSHVFCRPELLGKLQMFLGECINVLKFCSRCMSMGEILIVYLKELVPDKTSEFSKQRLKQSIDFDRNTGSFWWIIRA